MGLWLSFLTQGGCPKRGRWGMREWLLTLTLAVSLILAVGLTAIGCSGGGDERAGRGDEGEARNGVAERTKPLIGSDLGHQAFQPSTRLVVPDGVGTPFDRVGRVLAGLAEGTLGVRMFVNQRPGEEGYLAWRDVAAEEPEGHEIADAGRGTVYRAGALRLGRDLDVDISTKTFANKSPVEAIYNGDVETALVPLDWNVYSDLLAGELTPLVVLSEMRAPDLPNVPTAKELGHDVTVPVFGGVAAPSGTPPDVVDELGRAFVGASSSRTFDRALVGTGREPEQKGPEEFEAYVEKQAKLLRERRRPPP